jgi:hypothetical protein
MCDLSKSVYEVTEADSTRSSFITSLVHRILKVRENAACKNTPKRSLRSFPHLSFVASI